MEGEFQDRLNHDSVLTVEFAEQADGLIAFEMDYNSESILESGHEAPESGYERAKRARKSIWTRKGLRSQQPGYVEYERVNEVREDVGYYIRIRTELDENGNVISAYYGKIYGDFDFYGARPGGSFVTADAYYLNSVPNDRNVWRRNPARRCLRVSQNWTSPTARELPIFSARRLANLEPGEG